MGHEEESTEFDAAGVRGENCRWSVRSLKDEEGHRKDRAAVATGRIISNLKRLTKRHSNRRRYK